MSNLMQRFDYKNAATSPWGKIDSVTKYMTGVSFIGTPRHGGFRITERALRGLACDPDFLISKAIKQGKYLYFEEDCDAALLLFDCPRLLVAFANKNGKNADELFESCKKSVAHWNADYFKIEEKGA